MSTGNEDFVVKSGSSQVEDISSPSHPKHMFYETFLPLAILYKVFGVFSLQNVLQTNGHLLSHRLLSPDTFWGPVLHVVMMTVHAIYEDDPWVRLFLPYIIGRTSLSLVTFLFFDGYLPQLISSIETFDENCYEIQSIPIKKPWICLGKTWVSITIISFIVCFAGTLLEREPSSSLWFKITMALLLVLPLFVRVMYTNTFMCLCCNMRERFKVIRVIWKEEIAGILNAGMTSCEHSTGDVTEGQLARGRRRDGWIPAAERRLERIRLSHADLVTSCQQLNTCYGVLLVFYFLAVFFAMLVDLYQFIYMTTIATASQIIYCVFNTLSMFFIVNFAGNLTEASQDIAQDLGSIPIVMLSGACQGQVQMFLSYLSANKVEINAAGFCVVNRGTLVSILIYMTTYMIVIVQFSPQLMKFTSTYNSTQNND